MDTDTDIDISSDEESRGRASPQLQKKRFNSYPKYYRTALEKDFPWMQPSELGNKHFFCRICKSSLLCGKPF